MVLYSRLARPRVDLCSMSAIIPAVLVLALVYISRQGIYCMWGSGVLFSIAPSNPPLTFSLPRLAEGMQHACGMHAAPDVDARL